MKSQLSSRVLQSFLKFLGNDVLTVEEIKEGWQAKHWKDIKIEDVIDFLLEEREILLHSKNHDIAYMRTPRIRWKNRKGEE